LSSIREVTGHEVVGVIDALGPGVKGFKIGERVGGGWFGGSCGYCGHCRRDAGFACENIHEVTGVSCDGGYATHMVALVSAVAHFPDDLDPIEAAPLLAPASHNLQRVLKGETPPVIFSRRKASIGKQNKAWRRNS